MWICGRLASLISHHAEYVVTYYKRWRLLTLSQLVCTISALPASGCSVSDVDCICRDTQLAQTVSGCMLANCTMQESLQTARVQAEQCKLSRQSKRTEVFTYTIIVYSLAILCVILRIAGKLISKRLSLDDYIVVFAILISALPVACVISSMSLVFLQSACTQANMVQ